MLGHSPSYLPKEDVRSYRAISFIFYILFIVIIISGALSFLFPYQRYAFDFNNPDATKNNLFEPHLGNFSPVEKGKVPANDTFSAYANNPQVLESGDVTIIPSDASESEHLEGLQVEIRKGWAATFFPVTDPLDIPEIRLVSHRGNFYEDRNSTLYPLVSEAAAKSWLPEERITEISDPVFESMTLDEELIGFRPGSLLAYADGVFFVTEEGTIRPFGSAEVLLRSGYSFDHIIPASGEDVGIYKRGKIILPGELHLGGTLFKDTDSQELFLFQNKRLRPLSKDYGNFLSSRNDVVSFSKGTENQIASCTLSKKLFQKAYACEASLLSLKGTGNDYQIALTSAAKETDIQALQAGLQSSRQQDNARATFRSLMTRILERIGLY